MQNRTKTRPALHQLTYRVLKMELIQTTSRKCSCLKTEKRTIENFLTWNYVQKSIETYFRNMERSQSINSHPKKRHILPIIFTANSNSILRKFADALLCHNNPHKIVIVCVEINTTHQNNHRRSKIQPQESRNKAQQVPQPKVAPRVAAAHRVLHTP